MKERFNNTLNYADTEQGILIVISSLPLNDKTAYPSNNQY